MKNLKTHFISMMMWMMFGLVAKSCALYRTPSFGDTLGELIFALGAVVLFGAPWLILGLAICLIVWTIQLICKAVNKATQPKPPADERSVWDRLEE